MNDCSEDYSTYIEPAVKRCRKMALIILGTILLLVVFNLMQNKMQVPDLIFGVLVMSLNIPLIGFMLIHCLRCKKNPHFWIFLGGWPVMGSPLIFSFWWPKKCPHCHCVFRGNL